MNDNCDWRMKPVLDIHDLQRIFPRPRVYSLFHTHGFPAFKVGRRFYVRTDAFIAWMDEQARRQAEM